MDFAIFFANIWDELTGSTSVIEQRGEIRYADGTVVPNLVQVSTKNEDVIPICNETGAQYLTHHIRLIFNKHTALGELGRDEIADIAGDAIMAPINTMMFNSMEYGIVNLEKLETEGLGLWDSLYIFLTGLKGAGVRNLTRDVYTIKVETRQAAEMAQESRGLGK